MEMNSKTCFLLICICVFIYIWRRMNKTKCPPCLPWIPFLGSTPWIKSIVKVRKNFHVQLTELSKLYGPVFACKLQSYTVVINGYEAIKEALITKGSVFAGRHFLDPKLTYANPKGLGIVMGQYSYEWKKQRMFCLQMLRRCGFGKSSSESKIMEEAECLVEAFHRKEEAAFPPKSIFVQCVCNCIFQMICGRRFELGDEKLLHFLNSITELLRAMVDMPFGIHSPFLQWLPEVRRAKARMLAIHEEMLLFCREQIRTCPRSESNEEATCLIDAYLREFEKGENELLSLEQLENVLADLFIAGAETTSTTMQWALLYMANNPYIQENVQNELTSVLGESEVPSIRHCSRLPYCQAVLTEVQRISCIVPQAGHKTSKDTQLCNMDIAKGTDVIINLHSVLMDPTYWTNPEKFNPDRFYQDGQYVKDPRMISFGLGARGCFGKQFATQSIFLFFTNTMHHFTIKCPDDIKLEVTTKTQATREPSSVMIRAVPRRESSMNGEALLEQFS